MSQEVIDLMNELTQKDEELSEARSEIRREEDRLARVADLMGVPDGGRYINDWESRAAKIKRQNARIAELELLLTKLRNLLGAES